VRRCARGEEQTPCESHAMMMIMMTMTVRVCAIGIVWVPNSFMAAEPVVAAKELVCGSSEVPAVVSWSDRGPAF